MFFMCDTDVGRQSQARRMEHAGIGTIVRYLGVHVEHKARITLQFRVFKFTDFLCYFCTDFLQRIHPGSKALSYHFMFKLYRDPFERND